MITISFSLGSLIAMFSLCNVIDTRDTKACIWKTEEHLGVLGRLFYFVLSSVLKFFKSSNWRVTAGSGFTITRSVERVMTIYIRYRSFILKRIFWGVLYLPPQCLCFPTFVCLNS